RYEPAQQNFTIVDLPLPRRGITQLELPYVWNLVPLRLVPEDVVEYYAEVYDNDTVSGPKTARSETYLLRLPSLEEVFTDLNKGHEASMDELQRSLLDAKDLKEKIESINQDLKKNKEIDWQQQKKMEEIAQRYQELQKKLENVQSQLDDIVQQMQQQNVLSHETLEKYLELQQLFEELNSDELQKALRQMQQAMQNVNREQLQQALQHLTFSEERFRQSIERTMNLLKRIQIEQKLDEVKKRAQEIAESQDQLKNETGGETDDRRRQEELARQQEDLKRKQDDLEREARNLQDRMEEFFTEMPAEKLERLLDELAGEQIGKRMEQAAGQMKSGQSQHAQMTQEEIRRLLQQFAQSLEGLQQEMLQQQSQHAINELRRAINNLLQLSKRKEEIHDQARSAPPNSPQLRQNAQDQMRVMQDLGNVINALGELSQRSFAVTPEMGKTIGEAIARMQNAMKALDVRSGQTAAQEQGSAMGSLNRAATHVQNSLQAMMESSGGGGGMGGLMQQLQQMAEQQMGINLQSRQMGEGMSPEERAMEAARLAAEQGAVQQSLEQLSREAQSAEEGRRILGDLDRIAEEMQEVVRNLEQNNINPETVQRQ
ncbi:MAG: hypothetical protein WD295_06545, partial [Bacteroidota bacterium]